MTDYLILDISNLLFRSYYANKSETDMVIGGLAMHSALFTIKKYFQLYKPKKRIVMCYDRANWRVSYSRSDECISGKIYKGDRRKNFTNSEMKKYERFLEHLKEFEKLMKEHTSVVCLAADKLEADDLVAGLCQLYPDDKTVIVSTDKDFMQLLINPNVTLINPADGTPRTLEDFHDDAKYFLYEKCFRGDTSDCVQSAFPRIRKTKIFKSYNDPLEHVNLMNETWTNQDGKEFIVKHLFKENQLLMDLTKQPEEIRTLIEDTITTEMENPGKYSYFHFLQFLGKFKMKKVAQNAETFAKMLNL